MLHKKIAIHKKNDIILLSNWEILKFYFNFMKKIKIRVSSYYSEISKYKNYDVLVIEINTKEMPDHLKIIELVNNLNNAVDNNQRVVIHCNNNLLTSFLKTSFEVYFSNF